MHVIWQGKGLFVFYIFLAACVAGTLLSAIWVSPLLRIADDDHGVRLAVAIAALLAAAATLMFCQFLARARQRASDPTSAARPALARDTLFFIDIRYWTFVFLALAAAMLLLTFLA